jgi:hypothetical protein
MVVTRDGAIIKPHVPVLNEHIFSEVEVFTL